MIQRISNPAYVPSSPIQYTAPVNGARFSSQPPQANGVAAEQEGIRPVVGEDALKRLGEKECSTCEGRKYQDGSNDASVSYQSPTRIAPEAAASAVRSHEQEHVRNEQMDARREGRKVISQSVQIKTSCCPECGRVYVSGGNTRTVTKADHDQGVTPAADERGSGRWVDKKL